MQICSYCERSFTFCLLLSTPQLNSESPSTTLSPFLSIHCFLFHGSFPLCGSWQTNLNLFHCDIAQELHSCSGASLLGAPAPLPAVAVLPAGTGSPRFSGVFPPAASKQSALLLRKSVPATVLLVMSLSSSGVRHFPHS